MYRELLDEFNKIADEVSDTELEVLAEAVLTGLDKLADEEIDKMDKLADLLSGDLEKAAADDDEAAGAKGVAALLGIAGAGLGIAGAMGGAKLKQKLPGWKQQRLDAKKMKFQAKADAASKAADDAAKFSAKHSDLYGLDSKDSGKKYYRKDGKGNWNNKKLTPGDRLSKEVADTNPDLAASDLQALKVKDTINNNKGMILAGLGGTALVANQALTSSKKDAELAGVYNMALRR